MSVPPDAPATKRDVRHVRTESMVLYVFAFVVLIAVLGLAANNRSIAHRADDASRIAAASAKTATKGVEVSCILLSNIAAQSGAVGTGSDASPAARVQKAMVALVFDVAVRGMTPAERRSFDKLYAQFRKAGPYVTLPKCSQVARHPETVVQLGSPKAQRKP